MNDSGSDKDSDADDSKTETSLDTPLSPMVGLGTHPVGHPSWKLINIADPIKIAALNPGAASSATSKRCEVLRADGNRPPASSALLRSRCFHGEVFPLPPFLPPFLLGSDNYQGSEGY